ncbi:TIM23 complex component [Orbilia brochopaga]|uniref:Presequence translocated-associated motor subunit PAM17 n=1 Tax=Orbilia brochopaga TaxID=3140254 RepID=A0AAV9URW2_9PEZI
MAASFVRVGLRTAPAFSPFICTRPLLHAPLPRQSLTRKNVLLRSNFATAATTPTASAPKSSTIPPGTLDWNSFLKLRKQKRRYNLAGSVVCSMVTSAIGLNILGTQEIDPSKMIWGLDPLMVLGLGLIACGATGWLIGPVVGTQAFKLANRRWLSEITRKEKEFFDHIRKNRVDPSFQSFSNPVPDYYGEKIGSLSQYRQWLKDQRAYNRKREKFL